MQKLINASRRMSQWMVWTGGVLIFASAVLVAVEVIIRKLFVLSIGGADELSGYALGMATALSLAYTLHTKANIRIDALYRCMPRNLRTAVNILGLGLLTSFAAVATYMAWELVADTIHHGSRAITPMRTHLALPQVPWLFGWLFFVVTGVLLLLAAIVCLIQGDRDGAEKLIGAKEIDEMIQEEQGN